MSNHTLSIHPFHPLSLDPMVEIFHYILLVLYNITKVLQTRDLFCIVCFLIFASKLGSSKLAFRIFIVLFLPIFCLITLFETLSMQTKLSFYNNLCIVVYKFWEIKAKKFFNENISSLWSKIELIHCQKNFHQGLLFYSFFFNFLLYWLKF
jgi:hypothetical protein